MSDKPILPGPDGIEPINLKDALEERYLAYALSTIMHRALPDVRDGLKPVHRRILYAMHQLRLTPDGGFLKCAKIVGDAMGDYHPHGNQAIYDALARLAQDFAVRYPLIDGQGNFGNVDGDNPAAERYTEARITTTAADLLEGLEEETVDFRPNYDGRKHGAGGAAGGVPESAGQRLVRHRRRHGDQHSPAQRRRAVRGAAASHQAPERDDREAGRDDPRAGLSRPAACWSSRRSRSSKPTRRAAAASGCAPSGRRRTPGAAPIRSSSPRSPIRCRRPSWSSASPSC